MSNETVILAGTAAALGFVHTIFGPDHYLPFIALAKARGWSSFKTAIITFLCGMGHILSSVILGLIGIAFGIAIFKLEAIEYLRGQLAAWLLIVFGFVYSLWGLQKIIHSKIHKHLHSDRLEEDHLHSHNDVSHHFNIPGSKPYNLTPWVLFIIFVFGPCELLIPIVMYPAAKHNIIAVAMVSSIFGFTTIFTMLVIVLASFYGLSRLPLRRFERYFHLFAGLVIFLCGIAIKFLGL